MVLSNYKRSNSGPPSYTRVGISTFHQPYPFFTPIVTSRIIKPVNVRRSSLRQRFSQTLQYFLLPCGTRRPFYTMPSASSDVLIPADVSKDFAVVIPHSVKKRVSVASTCSGNTTPDKQVTEAQTSAHIKGDNPGRCAECVGCPSRLRVSSNIGDVNGYAFSHKPFYSTDSRVMRQRLVAFLQSSDFESHLSQNFVQQLWFDRSNFAIQVVYRTFRMLRSCQYHPEDIVQCAALTICHWPRIRRKINRIVSGQRNAVVDLKESVYIGILQLFLAHCWLLDQTCPLKEWHRHVFYGYCSFSCLNDAMMKLFALQEFKLSFDPNVVRSVVAQLVVPCTHVQKQGTWVPALNF